MSPANSTSPSGWQSTWQSGRFSRAAPLFAPTPRAIVAHVPPLMLTLGSVALVAARMGAVVVLVKEMPAVAADWRDRLAVTAGRVILGPGHLGGPAQLHPGHLDVWADPMALTGEPGWPTAADRSPAPRTRSALDRSHEDTDRWTGLHRVRQVHCARCGSRGYTAGTAGWPLAVQGEESETPVRRRASDGRTSGSPSPPWLGAVRDYPRAALNRAEPTLPRLGASLDSLHSDLLIV
jgi:hypothetical protein